MKLCFCLAAAASTGAGVCGLEEINAEASASFLSKKLTGAKRSLFMISDMVFGAKSVRVPRKFSLALVGFGRTGTTSFHSSLKTLGYQPIHDDEVLEVVDLYEELMKDGSMSTDDIAAEMGRRGFDSAFIMTHKFVEWAAAAPDVKVVLTVRDRTKWARSWLTVSSTAYVIEMRPFKWIKALRRLQPFNREVMVNVPTNGHPELYQHVPTLEAGYDAWVDFVISTVPAERLLVFDVRQGWGPLCRFLDRPVPVPQMPYPHINDRAVVDATVRVFLLITWIWPILFALPLLGLWVFIRWIVRRRVENSQKKDL